MPLVSVVMPAYNAEKYIEEAIKSILNQTFTDFEFVIVDDASTDGTASIIGDYVTKDSRIVYIRNEHNLNIGGALNKGISAAKSEYIARMDADDLSLPERLEQQYKVISHDPLIGVVGANIEIMSEVGKLISSRKYPVTNNKLKSLIFRYSPFAHPVVMFRKSAWEKVGGYDPKASPTEDVDLWFKIGNYYKFASVDKTLLKYRYFESSSSNKKLHALEIKLLKLRIHAAMNYSFIPSVYDIFYNIGQFVTSFIMPVKLRLLLFDFIRNRGLL